MLIVLTLSELIALVALLSPSLAADGPTKTNGILGPHPTSDANPVDPWRPEHERGVYRIRPILSDADASLYPTTPHGAFLTIHNTHTIKWTPTTNHTKAMRVYFHPAPKEDTATTAFLIMYNYDMIPNPADNVPKANIRRVEAISYLHPRRMLVHPGHRVARWEVRRLMRWWDGIWTSQLPRPADVLPPLLRKEYTDRWDVWVVDAPRARLGAWDPAGMGVWFDWIWEKEDGHEQLRLCLRESRRECEEEARRVRGVRMQLKLEWDSGLRAPEDPLVKPKKPAGWRPGPKSHCVFM